MGEAVEVDAGTARAGAPPSESKLPISMSRELVAAIDVDTPRAEFTDADRCVVPGQSGGTACPSGVCSREASWSGRTALRAVLSSASLGRPADGTPVGKFLDDVRACWEMDRPAAAPCRAITFLQARRNSCGGARFPQLGVSTSFGSGSATCGPNLGQFWANIGQTLANPQPISATCGRNRPYVADFGQVWTDCASHCTMLPRRHSACQHAHVRRVTRLSGARSLLLQFCFTDSSHLFRRLRSPPKRLTVRFCVPFPGRMRSERITGVSVAPSRGSAASEALELRRSRPQVLASTPTPNFGRKGRRAWSNRSRIRSIPASRFSRKHLLLCHTQAQVWS